jgi:hypothetical protein
LPLVEIPGAPIVGYLLPEPARRQHSAWRGRKVEVLEDIAAGLKLPSKKLFSPMKALIESKKLKTEGVRAGMTYSVK